MGLLSVGHVKGPSKPTRCMCQTRILYMFSFKMQSSCRHHHHYGPNYKYHSGANSRANYRYHSGPNSAFQTRERYCFRGTALLLCVDFISDFVFWIYNDRVNWITKTDTCLAMIMITMIGIPNL